MAPCSSRRNMLVDETSAVPVAARSLSESRQALFVDPLTHLPADVVFLMELCLPVRTLVALSGVSVAWNQHLCEKHWHCVFQARWSHCYEGGQGLTVSPSILSRLTGNYHSFWGTIEKAFMGHYSVLGNQERDSLFEKLFKLLQPAIGGGWNGPAEGTGNTENEGQPHPHAGAPSAGGSNGGGGGSSYSPSSRLSASFFTPTTVRRMHGFPYYCSRVVAPPLPSSWKLACILRDRAEGRHVLMGCRFCGQLDVFTKHMRDQESSSPTQLRTWVVPCLCPALVHRRCLEAHVADLQQSVQACAKPAPSPPTAAAHARTRRLVGGDVRSQRRWISYDSALHAPGTARLAEKQPLGPCARCGSLYLPGFRLPTVRELIAVTWEDEMAWRRAGDCLLMWVMGVSIVALSEAAYRGHGELLFWPEEGGQVLFWWMFQYVISLNIFLSPRFARVVDLLWLGPIFRFYAKLYLYFLLATLTMLCTYTPLPRRVLGLSVTEALGIPGWAVALAGTGNFAVLWTITSIVIFLFWKTNYRIQTIADLRQTEAGMSDFEHPMLSIGGA